jgi:sugar/nucleoside kinase (ribokinase family)
VFRPQVGNPVRLIGCIGQDNYSDVAVSPIEEIGIDPCLHMTEERPSKVATAIPFVEA